MGSLRMPPRFLAGLLHCSLHAFTSCRLFEKIVGEEPRTPKPVRSQVDGQDGYKVKCGGVSCIFEVEAYRFCGHEPDDTSPRPSSGTGSLSHSEHPRSNGEATALDIDQSGSDAQHVESGDTSGHVDDQSGSNDYSTPPQERASAPTDSTLQGSPQTRANGTGRRSASNKNASTRGGAVGEPDNSQGTEV